MNIDYDELIKRMSTLEEELSTIKKEITSKKSICTFTEEEFIRDILDKKIYDKDLIGSIVTTRNYNKGRILPNDTDIVDIEWVIADVDHKLDKDHRIYYPDNNHYYDLISLNGIRKCIFSEYNNIWEYSNVHHYLNDSFFNTFSNSMKNHMLKFVFESAKGKQISDYIVMPSITELGLSNVFCEEDGIKYPIFDTDESRIKCDLNGEICSYWTRSRFTYYSSYVWYVGTDGSMYHYYYANSFRLAPSLRIS